MAFVPILIIVSMVLIFFILRSKNTTHKKDFIKTQKDDGIIRLPLSQISNVKYYSVMPRYIYDKIEDAILAGKKSIEIKESLFDRIKSDSKKLEERNKSISRCANLNNKGISFEKSGKTNEAISVYEENIKDGYPATHSYDRLMILYRKNKDYENEKRIIEVAIQVFTTENEIGFKRAFNDPKNKIYKDDLQIAHETNTGVKNNEGWYVYCPYNTMKYIERFEKVTKLMKKAVN